MAEGSRTVTPEPVALLTFRSPAQPGLENDYPVYPNAEFDIGRRLVAEALEVEDRAISTHHLRIRCVVYEDDQERQVSPMVYMRVLSSLNAVIMRRSGLDKVNGGICIAKNHGDMLLNPGDDLQLSPNIHISFNATEASWANPPRLDSVRLAEARKFANRYQLSDRVLGIGGYASIYVAIKHKTNQQFACKVLSLPVEAVDKSGNELRGAYLERRKKQETVAREYNVLKNLAHPNIITLEKVFRTSFSIYIFQELVTGGDLLSYLDNKGRLDEPHAAAIVRQLLEAVKYLHENQVVHRDIKPENVLMTSWRVGARIILTDFGQSRTIKDMESAAKIAGISRMQSVVGTYGYTAPEVYHQMKQDLQSGSGYSKAVDIWSIGCVTATLITNEFIFPDGRDRHVESTTRSQFQRHLDILDKGEDWQNIGHRVKSFIRGCLAIDENERMTATQCLAMSWFQHPHYRVEFDAAYKRAIQDWKPKEYEDDNIIEFIDTSDVLLENTVSRHFAAKPPPQANVNTELANFRAFESMASPVQVPNTSPHQQHAILSSSIPAPPLSFQSSRPPGGARASGIKHDLIQRPTTLNGAHSAINDPMISNGVASDPVTCSQSLPSFPYPCC